MTTVVHLRELRRLGAGRNPQVRRRLERDARGMARVAQILAAKDTGAGAASIHAEEQFDGTWRVSWDQEHAYMIFPELGTEHQSAQPALRPAAKRFEK